MKVIDKLVDIANNGESEIIQYFRYYNRNDNQFESCMLCLDNLIYKLNNGELDINDDIGEDYTPKEDKKIEKIDISKFPKRNNSLKKTALKVNQIIDLINNSFLLSEKEVGKFLDKVNGDK